MLFLVVHVIKWTFFFRIKGQQLLQKLANANGLLKWIVSCFVDKSCINSTANHLFTSCRYCVLIFPLKKLP